MSKGLKKILPVAAMFIPVVGPAISTKLGLSGALGGALGATAGKVAGSALVGGALNKAAGGSFALGAIGGGIGGLTAAGTAAGTAASGGAKGAMQAAKMASAASGGNTIIGAIQAAGGQIAQGLRDPGMWGRAAQYLAAAAIGQATAKPDPALQAYINELQRVSASNQQIQQTVFSVGNELAAEARSISPTMEGLRAGTEARIQTLAAGEQALREAPVRNVGLQADLRRQYYTDAARAGASAFTMGALAGRQEKRAGLQGAYSGVPILQAQGAGAAQLSMQQAQNEGSRQSGLLESFKYITTGQQPAGGAQEMTKVNLPQTGTPPIVPPGSVTGNQPMAGLTGSGYTDRREMVGA